MKLHVLSFDFDGCLFNDNYIKSNIINDNLNRKIVYDVLKYKDVITHNKKLFADIKETNKNFDEAITIIGSNRQSLKNDFHNAKGGRGSCFPVIEIVSEYLGTKLDKYMLADTYGLLPSGTSFERAKRSLTQEGFEPPHADFSYDSSKATLIYAQIHKIANQYPNDEITFDFYDDRQDILDGLLEFYTQYPDLLPKNVRLNLNQYAGELVTNVGAIEGAGMIDKNYEQTIRDMINVGILNRFFRAVEFIKPEKLVNRIPKLQHEKETRDTNPVKYNEAIDYFFDQLIEIHLKEKKLWRDGYYKAADHADELYTKVKSDAEKYLNGTMDKMTFRQNVTQAIDAARGELEKHRGWKQILGNLAVAVLLLVVFYPVGLLINKLVSGNFLFFKTDSAIKLEKLEQSLEGVVPTM